MDNGNRIAVLGIIIEDLESAERVNALLHERSEYIVGRLGIPYRDKHVSVISVVLDAPQDVTTGLTGKLGMLHGVSAKALYSAR